ncbi:hypothetical protein D9619_007750 [Psilocybe cf. subviscida]|uniref:Uncharacterized protein n=1 Tax=Psilocybe cf. subviscida TaxID=2480587 RepID=A0A8H5AUC5_9AGAR|nr:hypothetical protein D9619_007750 [Psilocybe cf. subviscida]
MPFSSASKFLDVSPTSIVAPYDEVTVVSQRSLNALLKKAFDETPALHKVSFKAPPAGEDDDDFSGCKVIFDAPKVELQISTENRIAVLLLNIKGGSLQYLKVSGRQVSEETANVPAFTIALDVNLVVQQVPFTSLPGNIRTRFASSKDLTISKTFIDLKVASFARLRKSLTTLYGVVQDLTQTTMLTTYLEQYLKLLADNEKKFVFNYFATAPSSTAARAVYPLLSVTPTGNAVLQNLPANNSTEHTKTGEESLLAFLEMTEDGVMPRTQLPTADSNWAAGIDTRVENPVVVISKSKFLEKSIISKLTDINKRSTWIIDKAIVEATIAPPEVNYALAGHLGWQDAKESDLAWVPMSFENVPVDARVKVGGTGAWYHFKHADYRTSQSKMIYEVSQRATTENFIFVPEGIRAAGKTQIFVFGSTLVDFNTRRDFSSSSGWARNQWSTQIIFDSSKPEEPITVTTEDTVCGKTTMQTDDDEFGAKIIAPAKEQLERFEFSLRDLGTRLRRALQADWPFFIPVRGGPYYVDRAFFGKGLDFICEMKPHDA